MKTITKQFLKFGIIGVANTSIDFLLYYFLTRYIFFFDQHKVFTACLAFIVANVNSYIFNKIWTFQNNEKKHHVLYFKFLVISVIGLIINILIFNFLLKLNIHDLIAKMLPIPIVIFWNFIANKIWTFQNRQI